MPEPESRTVTSHERRAYDSGFCLGAAGRFEQGMDYAVGSKLRLGIKMIQNTAVTVSGQLRDLNPLTSVASRRCPRFPKVRRPCQFLSQLRHYIEILPTFDWDARLITASSQSGRRASTCATFSWEWTYD